MPKLINTADRIYVAGHRGMAGSAICRALQHSGYGDTRQGEGILKPPRENLDLLDPLAVKDWFTDNQPTVVVLAAAKVGGILANSTYPADFLIDNLKIQTNVIESAWRSGVRRLLFLGSSCIYPKFAEQPIREESLLTGALEPTNEWYAIAKIAGIKLCQALRTQHGFDAISLMPTNLYGPGDNYHPKNCHVLPALIRRFHEATGVKTPSVVCWGTGKPLREFLHVDDLGEACVFALEHWQPQPNELSFLNVGTGVDLPVQEPATIIDDACGYMGNIQWDGTKPDGTPKKQLNVSRLASLGRHPRIKLAGGIKSTYKHFLDAISDQSLRGVEQ